MKSCLPPVLLLGSSSRAFPHYVEWHVGYGNTDTEYFSDPFSVLDSNANTFSTGFSFGWNTNPQLRSLLEVVARDSLLSSSSSGSVDGPPFFPVYGPEERPTNGAEDSRERLSAAGEEETEDKEESSALQQEDNVTVSGSWGNITFSGAAFTLLGTLVLVGLIFAIKSGAVSRLLPSWVSKKGNEEG